MKCHLYVWTVSAATETTRFRNQEQLGSEAAVLGKTSRLNEERDQFKVQLRESFEFDWLNNPQVNTEQLQSVKVPGILGNVDSNIHCHWSLWGVTANISHSKKSLQATAAVIQMLTRAC